MLFDIQIYNRLSDHEKLVRFHSEVRDFIEQEVLVEGRQLFQKSLCPFIAPAWDEYLVTNSQGDAATQIRETPLPKLEKNGLTRDQFQLKIMTISHIYGKLRDRLGGSIKSGVLQWLFAAIDTVLDSLIVTVGLSHALKEIKDILNNQLALKQEPNFQGNAQGAP